MKNEVYKALNTLNEYLAHCSFRDEYVETLPTAGQFSYDVTLEAIHLNSDGSKSRFFEIFTDKLKIGDIIEVEVEVANVGNGDLGKIIIVDLENAENYYQVLSTNNSSEFKKIKVRHIVNQTTSFKVGVGISNGTTGEIKIRNFKVKTYSSYQLTNTRKVVLEGHNNFAEKFTIRNDFAVDPVSLNVGLDGIVVTWTNPFTSSKRPVPSLAMDYVGNSPNYIVRIGAVTATNFVIRFYNATTGTLVNVADLDLSASIFLYVTCNI